MMSVEMEKDRGDLKAWEERLRTINQKLEGEKTAIEGAGCLHI